MTKAELSGIIDGALQVSIFKLRNRARNIHFTDAYKAQLHSEADAIERFSEWLKAGVVKRSNVPLYEGERQEHVLVLPLEVEGASDE